MKLIKPSFEIWQQPSGLEGIYKQIEHVGRVCYKSEDKITEDSAKPFVDRMIKSQHYAMLEHGTLYFKIPVNIDEAGNFLDEVSTWTKCKLVESPEGNWWAITTNLRVMMEHFASEYMEELISKYLCEPTEHHERRVTVKFITDQGILREFTRHRVFSFAVESTRYCNYSKDKFNNEVAYIIPSWLHWDEQTIHYGDFEKSGSGSEDSKLFVNSLLDAEKSYFRLLKEGWKPQQARNVLPLATKCDVVMTGFVSDWKHFFRLRTSILAETGRPHPDASALADPLYKEFIDRGYMESLV